MSEVALHRGSSVYRPGTTLPGVIKSCGMLPEINRLSLDFTKKVTAGLLLRKVNSRLTFGIWLGDHQTLL
jgi:hypothetical protein